MKSENNGYPRKGRRVIVWGINYFPEKTGIAPYNKMVCDHLAKSGFEVEMVTAFPYYPEWRKSREDSGRLYRRDQIDDVPVHRCWHYVPSRVSTLKRMIHEASFVVTSFLKLLTLKRADLYIVVSPPLLLGSAAWLLSLLKRAPYVFHVQDLQPDAALGLGMIKEGPFIRLLFALEKLAYGKAARVSGISGGMVAAFKGKGVPAEKITYFPNPVHLGNGNSHIERGMFRQVHGFKESDFLVVYSGNLGAKQGIEIAVEAAALLADTHVKFVICGEGARRAHLANFIHLRKLNNVTLLPLLERHAYHEMLVDADVCLITQQRGSGRAFFPSKLLATLAFAKPVITVADEDSELYRALMENGFGVNILPGEPRQLAEAVKHLSEEPTDLAKFGEAGRRFVQQFDTKTVLGKFAATIRDILTTRDCRS
jgi:colanic acid biosynthesis glycosyl transferase WcaI